MVETNFRRDFLASAVSEFASRRVRIFMPPHSLLSNRLRWSAMDFFELLGARPLPVVSRLPDLCAPTRRCFHLGSYQSVRAAASCFECRRALGLPLHEGTYLGWPQPPRSPRRLPRPRHLPRRALRLPRTPPQQLSLPVRLP